MPLHHYVVRQAQTQSCSLAGRFGGEERLHNFLLYRIRNADAIVFNCKDNLPVDKRGANRYFRFIALARDFLLLIYRIKSIIEQVKQHPADILRDNIYFK